MPSTPPAKWRLALPAVALLAATLLAYQPALSGKLLWDDEAHVTRPELRSLHGLIEIWTHPGATQQYYPLVHSVFWLEHKLWGDAVVPYHLVNVFLHVCSALLLVLILRRLKVPGAWLAAAIFALHPVQVESVAWISETKNTLSAFLCLSAVLFYLRFDESRQRKSYWIALSLFALGLMSKSVIATMPAALLVIFWWKRGKISWQRDLFPLLPFFVVGVSSGLFTAWVEHNYIGARGEAFNYSLGERVLIAGHVFWFYLGKLLWPAKLTFIYPRWEISGAVWGQYLFPLAGLAVVLLCYLFRRRTRGPLAAVLLFAGLLFPALGFINVFPFIYSFVADHFQYLASIAIIASASATIASLVRYKFSPGIRFVGAGVLLTVLAILSWRQAHAYTDAETLYRDTIAKNPACWMAHNNLANALARSGRTNEAVDHYRAALKLRPAYLEAHYNLSNALLRRREVEEAIAEAEAALRIKADSAEAHNNLANALQKQGRFREAIEHYEAALAAEPDVAGTKSNLAWVLATCPDRPLQNLPRALSLAEEANKQSGGTNPLILHTLSAAYAQNGDLRTARATGLQGLKQARATGNLELVEILQRELAQLDRALSETN